jgi:hypothetical protein
MQRTWMGSTWLLTCGWAFLMSSQRCATSSRRFSSLLVGTLSRDSDWNTSRSWSTSRSVLLLATLVCGQAAAQHRSAW